MTRAQELAGVTLMEVIDQESQCASHSSVTTIQYGRSPKGALTTQSMEYEDAEVALHPGLEVLTGLRDGRTETVWVNADLAAIVLKAPVEFEFEPLALPEGEARVGDDMVMVGFGPGVAARP